MNKLWALLLSLALAFPLGAGLAAVEEKPAEAHHRQVVHACAHDDRRTHNGGYYDSFWYLHDFRYSFSKWGGHYHRVLVTKLTDSGVYQGQWWETRRC